MPLVFNDHSYGVGREKASEAKARWRIWATLLSILMFLVYIATGACIFIVLTPDIGNPEDPENPVRNNTFLESLYFATVTVTTVGYGDIVPQDDAGKIFVSVYVLVSMALVAFILDSSNFLYEDGNVGSQSDLFTMKGLVNFVTLSATSVSARVQLLYSLLVLFLVIGVGALFFALHENLRTLDAIYFSIVSMSGIGYGDVKPTTDGGRIFCILWLIVGTFALFRAVGSAMAVSVENRKHRWIERRARVLKEVHEGSPKNLLALPRSGLESIVAKDKYILWALEKSSDVSSSEVIEYANAYDNVRGTPDEEVFVNDQGHRRARHLKRHTDWARVLTFICILSFLAYAAVGALVFLELNPEFGSKNDPSSFQDTKYLDALYFIVVSLTTVGFGDITPTNDKTKIFLCVYILLSLPLVAFMLDVTNFFQSLTHDDEFLERVLRERGLLFKGAEKKDKDYADDNLKKARRRLIQSFVLIFFLILSGTLFYILVAGEDLSTVDALYFSVAAMSGVGFGDIVPKTDEGKIFAIFWVGVGTFSLFRAVGALMNVALEARIRRWEKRTLQADEVDFQALAEENRLAEAAAMDMSSDIMKHLANYSDDALLTLAMKQKYTLWRLETSGKVLAATVIYFAEEFDTVEDFSEMLLNE